MKVTVASGLFLVAVFATSVDGRKSARRTRGYRDADDHYAGDRRDLKGSGKNSNIFSHCSKSAKGTDDCTAHPSGMPSDVPSHSPSASPSLAPSVISDPPSSNPSAEPSLAPSSEPSESPSDAPSSEPSQSPSSAPSVSNAPTKGKGTPKSTKSPKSPKRARRLFDHGY